MRVGFVDPFYRHNLQEGAWGGEKVEIDRRCSASNTAIPPFFLTGISETNTAIKIETFWPKNAGLTE